MDTEIGGSGGPSKGVLDRIAVSNCLYVMPIEPCAVVFSIFIVVLYINLICIVVCLASDFFKPELCRMIIEEQTQREQARQRHDNTEPTSSTPSENTGRGSLASRILRPSILDKLTLKEPGVILSLMCLTVPVVFGIGNLYAISKRDLDFMWISVVIMSIVIGMMAITTCSFALQKRNVLSIICSLVWICFQLYGGLLLYSLYKQIRDEQLGDRT